VMWFPIAIAPKGEAVIVYPNLHGAWTVAVNQHDECWDILDDNRIIHPAHWMVPDEPKEKE
jgi:hypothetical protein